MIFHSRARNFVVNNLFLFVYLSFTFTTVVGFERKKKTFGISGITTEIIGAFSIDYIVKNKFV